MTTEMSTPTLAPEARRTVALFLNGALDGIKGKASFRKVPSQFPDTFGKEVDVFTLEDVPVFRSGTFRDSMGFQHTWEGLHIDQMVMHFDILRSRGILPYVPVRLGHPSFLGDDPVKSVVGWHSGLRAEERESPVDGKKYTYLLANYDILDEDAARRVNSGLLINRSAEVGRFVTNDEAEFWPVYQGFAYVDIPAVEGLVEFAKDRGLGSTFSLMTATIADKKEVPVVDGPDNTNTDSTNTGDSTPPAAPPAAPVAPPAAPAEGEETKEGDEGTGDTPPAAGTHAAPRPGAASFRIRGAETTDYSAVQQYIDAMERQAAEQRTAGVEAFVNELATQGKIVAAKLDQVMEYAKSLDDAQLTAWKASWDAVPASSLFGTHGRGSGSNHDGPIDEAELKQYERQLLEDTVAHHRASGLPEHKIQQLDSYKKLEALRAAGA